ncbi:MAG TPA: hypothetical protein VK812_06905 [Candidatus Binatus sp.]|nr:hypothetical protein [Candidatus Binatus sp.]
MDPAVDVNAALAFVINRIEEQAMRSGQPLDEEQRYLLNNLPNQSDVPEFSTGDPEFPTHFKLRDITYERLCALAKAAYQRDGEMNPGSPEWEFAFNVSKLNGHPMCWLLQWAGVKQRRPRWDRWLLVAASLLFIIATVPLMLLVTGRGWVLWRWAIVVVGYIGLVLFMRIVSQRIEERQLKQNIERCRDASHFVGTLT